MEVTLAWEVSIPEDSKASWRTNFRSVPTCWEFDLARHTTRKHEEEDDGGGGGGGGG